MSTEIPKAITIEVLQELCEEYKYEIQTDFLDLVPGVLPDIKIRYVDEKKNFGYTYFGNFFFYDNNLYVFEEDEKYKDQHDAEAVLATFEDECEGAAMPTR